MSKTWSNLTATDLGREIGAGRINPVDLTEFFLDKIASHPHAPRIYARTTDLRARGEAMAAASRAKAGFRRGPLDGVPLSWKDLFDTAGVATEGGSALLRGRTPAQDAEVLATATAQGLVCLGKTHMTELAFSGLGANPVTATPPCINDENAVPGGSSSGAAASVAWGLAPAAIGSDTGGSVRIPAAWNDLVGLKTTAGRIPLTGTLPLCPRFDTIGPIARSVEDCAHLLAVLEGRSPPGFKAGTLTTAPFLVLETTALDDLRPRPANAFTDALARLTRAGARLQTLIFPDLTEAMALAGILFTAEAHGTWGALIETAPQKMFPRVLDRFRSGAAFTASDYIKAWRRLDQIRAKWHSATAGAAAVLLPTSAILPPDANRLLTDDAYYVTENLLSLRNTRIGNLLGLCALTLPTSQPSCGISLMAPPGQEERLLRLGAAAERALA